MFCYRFPKQNVSILTLGWNFFKTSEAHKGFGLETSHCSEGGLVAPSSRFHFSNSVRALVQLSGCLGIENLLEKRGFTKLTFLPPRL